MRAENPIRLAQETWRSPHELRINGHGGSQDPGLKFKITGSAWPTGMSAPNYVETNQGGGLLVFCSKETENQGGWTNPLFWVSVAVDGDSWRAGARGSTRPTPSPPARSALAG